MKCKNCGHEIAYLSERERHLNTPKGGGGIKCPCGCKNPEPEERGRLPLKKFGKNYKTQMKKEKQGRKNQ